MHGGDFLTGLLLTVVGALWIANNLLLVPRMQRKIRGGLAGQRKLDRYNATVRSASYRLAIVTTTVLGVALVAWGSLLLAERV